MIEKYYWCQTIIKQIVINKVQFKWNSKETEGIKNYRDIKDNE
jgi:hypothetical protein